MTPSELTTRVTLDTCAAVAALAAAAWWLAGAPIAVGVLAGGALAIVNFRWLVIRTSVAMATGITCTAVCGLLLATGWAHPVALVAGFTVLPCDLIARGLASARTER